MNAAEFIGQIQKLPPGKQGKKIVALGLLLVCGGCTSLPLPEAEPVSSAASGESWQGDRLYFGREIPAGGEVSEVDWRRFMDEVVTPRFPAGLTVWRAEGHWREPDGRLVREASFVLEVFHRGEAEAAESLGEIAEVYRRRFGQTAVLRVSSPVDVRFYE